MTDLKQQWLQLGNQQLDKESASDLRRMTPICIRCVRKTQLLHHLHLSSQSQVCHCIYIVLCAKVPRAKGTSLVAEL